MRGSKKQLIIIISVLVFGASFEIMKSVSSQQSQDAEKTKLALARMNVSPYSQTKAGDEAQSAAQEWEKKKSARIDRAQSQRNRARAQVNLQQLAKQAESKQKQQEHSFTHEEDNKDKDSKETKKKNGDDKKNKDKDKKKKKKKKKKDGKEEKKKEGEENGENEDSDKNRDQEEPDDEASDQEDHDQERPGSSPSTETAGGDSGLPAGQAAGEPAESEEEDNDSLSYEEWARLLLNQPNMQETMRLIRMHQSHQVPDAIFYRLVEAMLEDSRMPMKELGILAAGRSPDYQSFVILARVVQNERYDSPLSAKAKKELHLYSQLTYLPILKAVMQRSEETFAILLAAEKLNASARHYLSAELDEQPEPDQSSQDANSSQPREHKNARYFQSFIPVLEYRSTNSKDGEVSSTINKTLETLQQLLQS